MDNRQLVENIRTLCRQKEIGINQLERDLHMSAGYLSRWSRISPSIDKVADVARALDVTIDQLIGQTETVSSDRGEAGTLEGLIRMTSTGLLSWAAWERERCPFRCDVTALFDERYLHHWVCWAGIEESCYLLLLVECGEKTEKAACRLFLLPYETAAAVLEAGPEDGELLIRLWCAIEAENKTEWDTLKADEAWERLQDKIESIL